VSTALEQSILASLLERPEELDAYLAELTVEHFTGHHKGVYQAVLELKNEGKAASMTLVYPRCDSGTLALLACHEVGTRTLAGHVQALIEQRRSERLQAILTECLQLAKTAPADEVIGGMSNRLLALSGGKRCTLEHIRATLKDTFTTIGYAMDHGGVTGLPTGYPELDLLTGGMRGGNLTIIAGRPAMGKSALAVNIAEHVVMNGGKAAVFSLEMTGSELAMRILSSLSRVECSKMQSGQVSGWEFQNIGKSCAELSGKELYIIDRAGMTLEEIRLAACSRKAASGLDLVIVDYLQIMKCSAGQRRDNREREVAENSIGLKSLAKELDVPVIAIAQLNRGLEARAAKTPMLSDLRESGAIEQDADVVLFVHRPGYYTGDHASSDAEIIVAKNRHGPCGKVRLLWRPVYTRFENAND
jgi:replicative DNA helicase